MNGRSVLWAAMVGLVVVTSARAEVVIDWVTVGDAGNLPDTRYATPGYGAVGYTYQIGKYEVTNGQYIGFLNAVAASDPHGLYSPDMGTWLVGGISRSGSPGSYTYGPKGGDANWLNRPVNWVDWYDTLRFANWLHNGQPTGPQDASTTEDGAYDLSLGWQVIRKPGAQVFLPTEDEWYKAAYYKGGGTNAGYWTYATQTHAGVVSEPPPGGSSSGNYTEEPSGHLAVGPPYYTTEVGAYLWSDSPYGTFDQGGNLWEWTATPTGGNSARVIRGGGWVSNFDAIAAWTREATSPIEGDLWTGFRLAALPEPGMIAYVTVASAAMLLRRKVKRPLLGVTLHPAVRGGLPLRDCGMHGLLPRWNAQAGCGRVVSHCEGVEWCRTVRVRLGRKGHERAKCFWGSDGRVGRGYVGAGRGGDRLGHGGRCGQPAGYAL